jgi:hypothetical protein
MIRHLVFLTLTAVLLSACQTPGLPSVEPPKLIKVNEAELNSGMKNVKRAISTRAGFRGEQWVALDIEPRGTLDDEYELCYMFCRIVHSNALTQAGAGGFIDGIVAAAERAVDRSTQGAFLSWEIAGAAALANAIGGARAAWQEEVTLFFNDVRQCTMRRAGKNVYIANVPANSE